MSDERTRSGAGTTSTSADAGVTASHAGTIVIPADVVAAIRDHAAEAYPNECCGAVFGDERVITGALRLPNCTAEGPRTRFLVLPADYRAAEMHAERTASPLAGFYHSHPDQPARPSQYDLDHAWPFFLYLIVSVQKGQSRDMTAWRLREDRSAFDGERLLLENQTDLRKGA